MIWDIHWVIEISCPVVCHPQFLVHPKPTQRWGEVKRRKDLDTVKALLINSKKISVLPTLFLPQIQNGIPHQLLWRSPAQASTFSCFHFLALISQVFQCHLLNLKIVINLSYSKEFSATFAHILGTQFSMHSHNLKASLHVVQNQTSCAKIFLICCMHDITQRKQQNTEEQQRLSLLNEKDSEI